MKTNLNLACLCLLAVAGVSCMQNTDKQTAEKPFHYIVDEFADLKVIRYRVPGWDSLTLRQKEYVYYLAEAAKSGRDIIWDQNFKYNLSIRKCLENIIESYTGNRECEAWQQFMVYAKRVFFSNGIHHHYAEEKFVPECGPEYMRQLVNNSRETPYGAWLIPIICDQDLYRWRKADETEGDILTASANNFYCGVSRKEAEAFYGAMENPKDLRPVSYGLNSRLVKDNGVLKELVWKADGLYGEAIGKICEWLEKAASVAENPEQAAYVNKLIAYYKTGDLKLWDEYNILWVRDTKSDIDFNNGFIETYGDPIGYKGSWGSNVSLRDHEATRRTETISRNAQWFEDHSPVDPRFKKKEVKGISAKVIDIAMLGGDNYPPTPIGINLPNADWIRKDYGSKSVTIANISHAYEKAAEESPKNMNAEFAWDDEEIRLSKEYGTLTGDLHTDLHECLGHGSGQLLPNTSPAALKDYSSTLEESRADLFALYYIADPYLIELGILPNEEAYKAAYISQIRNGLFTQLVRIEPGKTITEAHMQNRQLIAAWAYALGEADKVIEKRVRDGKTYFVINDYGKLREIFGRQLAEIQRIKSEGDYAAGKKLVEKYGMKVDAALHKEVLDRYAALNLKPYGGFLNPEIKPVRNAKGEITDYALEYVDSFLQQQLDYGKTYETLPALVQ